MVTTCTPRTSPKRSGQHNSLRNSPPTAVTPPTPSDVEEPAHHVTPVPSSPLRSPLRHLSAAMQTPALCTPANPALTISPPPDLRRDSLTVPCSATLRHLCKGSGVSVYRLERSPDRGVPRSPWVLKKANVSPLAFREVRRVESTLTHEARLLSQISHPHIVGFRAAQVRHRSRRAPSPDAFRHQSFDTMRMPTPFLTSSRNPPPLSAPRDPAWRV
eukprot:5096630-Pleurochrysis_carterae.AAC.2